MGNGVIATDVNCDVLQRFVAIVVAYSVQVGYATIIIGSESNRVHGNFRIFLGILESLA